jgi:DNA-binding IclR family transcriptional regulator
MGAGTGSGYTPLLVLSKIADILSAFTIAQPEQTLAGIRAATGLPPSTVQRLVGNLVHHGFLDKTSTGYRVGVRMRQWSAAAAPAPDVVDVVKPVLARLRDHTGETACFFQYSAGRRVCVSMAETRHVVRAAMSVGSVLPLHAGSAGRVILAWTSGLVDDVLTHGLDPVTERTIIDPSALRVAVRRARSDGYAITTGERESGASGLSAPVFDSQRELVGAVTIMGPAIRLSLERCQESVAVLLAAASELTAALHGRGPAEEPVA